METSWAPRVKVANHCQQIYNALCPGRALPKPRHAALRTLHDPSQPPTKDGILDSSALVLYFPSPNTVTGEDVLELHVHGGPAIVKAVLAAIPRRGSARHKIRYAEPGEFTRRAFLHGRLDLTQIEALGDTLAATTEQQRRLSVRGTTSGLARRYEEWRRQLLHARGELEALIDFSEDQHFDEAPAVLAASVARQVRLLRLRMRAHSANAVRGELLRNGVGIALLGAPNAGKSSLLNRIVGREAAIVSRQAGTTRDVVEVGVDIGGWYCRFGDTAGLRRSRAPVQNSTDDESESGLSATVGEVEQEGIKRAKQRALESDVVIVVLPLTQHDLPHEARLRLDREVLETAAECSENGGTVIVVINKIDRIRPPRADAVLQRHKASVMEALPSVEPGHVFCISCKDVAEAGAGTADPGNVQAFLHGLVGVLKGMTDPVVPDLPDAGHDPSVWQESLGATERQRLLLDECVTHLDAFLAEVCMGPEGVTEGAEGDVDVVVAAESLRAAAECLARITGKGEAGDVEEVLGVVFEK